MTNFQISDRVNLAIDDDFKKILLELKSQFPLLKESDLIKMAVSGFYTNQNNFSGNMKMLSKEAKKIINEFSNKVVKYSCLVEMKDGQMVIVSPEEVNYNELIVKVLWIFL